MLLQITDGSTVSVGGLSVVGPVSVYCDEVTISAVTYDHGAIVVVGGAASQVTRFTPQQEASIPWLVILPALLAFIWAKV